MRAKAPRAVGEVQHGTAHVSNTGGPPLTPDQRPAALIRVNETSVSEGNILEHPLFKLSNKEAKPTRAGGLLDRSDYRSEHRLGEGIRIVIEADMHHGYPTVFGLRVLLAVLEKGRTLGFPARRVPITRAEIARSIGYEEYGGRQYKLITEAILTLHKLTVLFENAWYDKSIGATVTGLKPEHLITDFYLGNTKGDAQQLNFAYNEEFVELGERLYESLRAGYRIGVDLDYLNKLGSPTAQRLYSYLTKKDGDGRTSYTETMMSIARKLPIAPLPASHIKRILERALGELEQPCARDGKKFLEGHSFSGKGSDASLTVYFASGSMRAAAREFAQRNPWPRG